MALNEKDVWLDVVFVLNRNDVTVVQLALQTNGSALTEVITGTGVARRDPNDKANPGLGFDLALARALVNIGSKALKRANGEVKRLDDVAQKKFDRAADEVVQQLLQSTIAAEDESVQVVKKAAKKKKTAKSR